MRRWNAAHAKETAIEYHGPIGQKQNWKFKQFSCSWLVEFKLLVWCDAIVGFKMFQFRRSPSLKKKNIKQFSWKTFFFKAKAIQISNNWHLGISLFEYDTLPERPHRLMVNIIIMHLSPGVTACRPMAGRWQSSRKIECGAGQLGFRASLQP